MKIYLLLILAAITSGMSIVLLWKHIRSHGMNVLMPWKCMALIWVCMLTSNIASFMVWRECVQSVVSSGLAHL
jgi:hypothetical protein